MNKALLVACLLFLSGCQECVDRKYTMRLIMPNGEVYQEKTIYSTARPTVAVHDGVLVTRDRGFIGLRSWEEPIPFGWRVEFEGPLAEDDTPAR